MESILTRPILDVYLSTILCEFAVRALFVCLFCFVSTLLHFMWVCNSHLSPQPLFYSMNLVLVGLATGYNTVLMSREVSEPTFYFDKMSSAFQIFRNPSATSTIGTKTPTLSFPLFSVSLSRNALVL